MVGIFQLADAIVLLGLVVCVLIFLADDPFYKPWWRRAMLVGLGLGLFSQSMWLLGVWIPGASGFPWPRLTVDVCLLAMALGRARSVCRNASALRQAQAAHKIGARA
jgi:hypothetical protein